MGKVEFIYDNYSGELRLVVINGRMFRIFDDTITSFKDIFEHLRYDVTVKGIEPEEFEELM